MKANSPSQNLAVRQTLALVGWLALCFSASLGAIFVTTDGWYANLNKPPWNPPAWLFGPVWTLLYGMMAVAAWLVWREGGWKAQSRTLRLFLLQWLLNALWTPLFFGLHRVDLALVDVVGLWITLVTTLVTFWQTKKAAGALLAPYLVWVSFAVILNFTIWQLNTL